MKSQFILLFISCLTFVLNAQSVGIGTAIPNSKAELEIKSNSRGLLIPRLTTTQRNNMALVATDNGMVIFNKTSDKFNFFDGTEWQTFSTTIPLWNETGSDLYYLSGNVGIGTSVPSSARLQVVTPSSSITGRFANNYTSDTEDSYALYAINTANGAHEKYGVYGKSEGAVNGLDLFGIKGIASPLGNNMDAYGGYFKAVNTGTGIHYGIYAEAAGANNYGVFAVNENNAGYAGYFQGRGFFTERVDILDKILLKPTGHGSGAEIEMYDDDGDQTVIIRANQSTTNGAEMLMYNDAAELTLELDADFNSGNSRIITDELQIKGGADLAEHFHVKQRMTEVEPGMVVSINEHNNGELIVTNKAYDSKVVGVISGANGIKPGMLMGQVGSIADGAYPVALTGRVYVLADATSHKIQPGHMLTTSSLPGYAMRAKNKRKANGASIGKALTGLKDGKGYVLMLVNLK